MQRLLQHVVFMPNAEMQKLKSPGLKEVRTDRAGPERVDEYPVRIRRMAPVILPRRKGNRSEAEIAKMRVPPSYSFLFQM